MIDVLIVQSVVQFGYVYGVILGLGIGLAAMWSMVISSVIR